MFCTIEEGLDQLRAGNFIIVVDDKDRENEGDLLIASEKVDSAKLNQMLFLARGILCIPMEGKRLDELSISLLKTETESSEKNKTAFCMPVDAKKDTTTGVSISDRITTIKALINPDSKPIDFTQPGHMFPLRAKEGGVLERPGHTEAAVDLCKLAGLYPGGVIAEIMKDDGEMAKLTDIEAFSKEKGLSIIKIGDLISYREKRDV